ncbi:MAG: LysM peptidoglycan-binding domain-containing protein [Chloroflexota bacterium]
MYYPFFCASTQPTYAHNSTHLSLFRRWIVLSVSLLFFTYAYFVLYPLPLLAADTLQSEQISAEAQQVAEAINQARGSSNLAPLSLNPILNQVAQGHVDDMVTNGNYSHIGSDGSTVRMRVVRSGYGSGNPASENWVSVRSPHLAIRWWMNSYPHRANILNRKWQDFGVGMRVHPYNKLYYFVVVFASRPVGTESVAPHVAAQSQSPQIKTLQATPTTTDGRYTVRSGDTLSIIATRFNVTWQTLASINSLNEHSILRVGQQIRISGSVGGPESSDPLPVGHYGGYTIQPGNTLAGVAELYDTTWQALALINNFDEGTVLSVGQIIRVPAQFEKQAEQERALPDDTDNSPATPATHVVQTGETIIQIASKYNVNWQALLRLNNLSDESILTVGQKLKLP